MFSCVRSALATARVRAAGVFGSNNYNSRTITTMTDRVRVSLSDIPTWSEFAISEGLLATGDRTATTTITAAAAASVNDKISLYRGDSTTLELDAIVNAANTSLLGGGGIDGAIHRAAGPGLREECAKLGGCATGETKLTKGYNLPAKYVLHTVGPVGENRPMLQSCYRTCLQIVGEKSDIRSVAFCGISTGIYGYPLEKATHVALETVREWLLEGDNASRVDRIVFVVFLERELECYKNLMQRYFPVVVKTQQHIGSEDSGTGVQAAAAAAADDDDDDDDDAETREEQKEAGAEEETVLTTEQQQQQHDQEQEDKQEQEQEQDKQEEVAAEEHDRNR